MKILIVINSIKPKLVGDRALRWCGRLGKDLIIVVPRNKRRKYIETIDDANYHYYLALTYDIVITRSDAKSYAIQHDYDLLVTVPEELWSWRKGRQFKENEIAIAYEALAKARSEFGSKPRKRIKRWVNGVTMERL